MSTDTITEEASVDLLPEDVFTREQLIEAAKRCLEPQEIYTYEQLKTCVKDIELEWKM